MTQTPPPLVTVVIPTWNRRDLLDDCLRALQAQTYRRFEVIVVDNGSRDGSEAMIRDTFGENIRIIRNEENLGYARAVNQGFAAADGVYVATLNNDAVVEPEWLAAIVQAAEGDPEIGMVASKIVSYDDPHIIDGTGLLLYPDGSSRARRAPDYSRP